MSIRIPLFVPIIVLCMASSGAVHAAPNPDAKELASYRLTMDTAHKVDAAVQAMASAKGSSPRDAQRKKLEAEAEALEQKDNLSDAEAQRYDQIIDQLERWDDDEDEGGGLFTNARNLDDMEAAIKRTPAAASALASAGIAPREYARFMMCWIQTGMAVGLKRTGQLKTLPPEVSPENVKFAEEHWAELEAMGRRWQALNGD
jgi:hypothetical protein